MPVLDVFMAVTLSMTVFLAVFYILTKKHLAVFLPVVETSFTPFKLDIRLIFLNGA